MITVEKSKDVPLLNSILRDPEAFAGMIDDSCSLDPSEVDAAKIVDNATFLVASEDGDPLGCFMFVPKEEERMEAHTVLLDNCRGSRALDAAKKAIKWIFSKTGCQEIVSYAWSDAPQLLWFARKLGFIRTGQKPYQATRHGKKVSVVNLSLTRLSWAAA